MVPDSQWCAWPSGGRHTNGPGQGVGLGRPLRGAGCETSRRAPAAGRRTTRARFDRRRGPAAAGRRMTRARFWQPYGRSFVFYSFKSDLNLFRACMFTDCDPKAAQGMESGGIH